MFIHSYQDTIHTVYEQLESLQTNYFDLYLIHWPLPVKPALYLEAWQALEKLYKDGIIRALGVSNFFVKHLENLMAHCEIQPMVNQIQSQPYYINHEVWAYCNEHGIQMESWQPFGGGVLLTDETICEIGKAHGKSAAQVILRWQLQKGFVAIPGPIEPEFITENIQIFDFELSEEEMAKIDAMECQKPIMLDVCKGVYDPDEFPLMW